MLVAQHQHLGPGVAQTPEQFRSVLDVNLHGAYWMAQAAAQAMVDGGSIVNISSVLGLTPQRPAPGGVRREQGRADRADPRPRVAVGHPQADPRQRPRAGLLRQRDERPVPARLPRLAAGDGSPRAAQGDPRELAATIVFLASDAAGYITGQTLPVDGGMTIT